MSSRECVTRKRSPRPRASRDRNAARTETRSTAMSSAVPRVQTARRNNKTWLRVYRSRSFCPRIRLTVPYPCESGGRLGVTRLSKWRSRVWRTHNVMATTITSVVSLFGNPRPDFRMVRPRAPVFRQIVCYLFERRSDEKPAAGENDGRKNGTDGRRIFFLYNTNRAARSYAGWLGFETSCYTSAGHDDNNNSGGRD